MRIADLNWMQVEKLLEGEDRCVLPIGCTEQHAYLSLATDTILAERMALEAAEPLGVPVFPALAYGLTPSFTAFPGTVTLSLETFAHLVKDLLGSLHRQGFRRILVVNGHGGNAPGRAAAIEWLSGSPGCSLKWHDWWNAPRTWAKVTEIDTLASHASWMENFIWTRLPGVASPDSQKPMVETPIYRNSNPEKVRAGLGDGSFGGLYQRSDHEMQELWAVAVAETRELLESGW